MREQLKNDRSCAKIGGKKGTAARRLCESAKCRFLKGQLRIRSIVKSSKKNLNKQGRRGVSNPQRKKKDSPARNDTNFTWFIGSSFNSQKRNPNVPAGGRPWRCGGKQGLS